MKSSAALCRENGWVAGDVLEGDEGHGPDRIRITAIGETCVLACCVQLYGDPVEGGEGVWRLHEREWTKVEPPTRRRASRLPGFRWRVLAHHRRRSADPVALEYEGHEGVCFDELVLWGGKDRRTGQDRMVLHLEQMNERAWWASIGDAYIWIDIPPAGPVEVSIRRGEHGPVCGTTEAHDEAATTREEG